MGKGEKISESARVISKKITDKVLPNQHIGSHSFETLWQEVYSLGNTKPMFREKKWFHNARNCRAKIITGIAKGNRKYQQLILFLNQVDVQR